MGTLHFPPESDNTTFMATTDQNNACLLLLYRKLGLPYDNPTDKISWTERFYIKTSCQNRNKNADRPYEAVYDEATVELNAQLNRQIDEVATYWVRCYFGKENVLGHLAQAQADPSTWRLFALTLDEGDFVPIYQQPYHGAVNLKTGQFVFYVFHPEPILRNGLAENFLELADMTMNLYADLLDIKTVRRSAFVKFSTNNITNAALWKSDNHSGKHKNVLKACLMMRWVEKHHNYRFSIGQLSQATMVYADKERLSLDDNATDSPIRQLVKHMSSKAHEVQRATGFSGLTQSRETFREAGFPNLVTAQTARRASQFEKQQADVEAVNKRKLEEDPNFVAPPPKKFEPGPGKSKPRPKVPCTVAGCKNKSMDQDALARHIKTKHSTLTAETPFKCAHVTCNRYFSKKSLADSHHKTCHSAKVRCPECERMLLPSSLNRHRIDQHGVAEENL